MRRPQLCDVGLGPPDKGHPALPGLSCLRAAVIQKIENFILQLKSITDSWMSPSSITLVMDMVFAILSGVVLFILLIPFLKNYPLSPPSERENTQEVMKRGQRKTRKKTKTAKGCRHGRKNVEETQNILQPFQIPLDSSLRDVTPHPFWNTNEKLKQLPLSQLLSYLKVLESLMWQKCSRFFSDMSSVLSESVVAATWVSKSSSSVQTRTVSTPDAFGVFPTQQQAQGLPPLSRVQSLPHQLRSSDLAGGTEAQTQVHHPCPTPNQTPSLFKSSTCGIRHPTIEMKVHESLSNKKQPRQKGLRWKTASNINIPRGGEATETIESPFIFSEHSKIFQYHAELENQERMTEDEGQLGFPFRFLPSQELMHSRGNFPQDNLCQSRNKPELPQAVQAPIFDSKSYKFSKMMGSMISGIPLRKSMVNVNIHDPIMEDLGIGAKYLPWGSNKTPVKGLDTRNRALWMDQPSHRHSHQDPSFLDLTPSTSSQAAAQQGHQSTQAHAYCLLGKTQKRKNILGTGRGNLQPSTSSRMARHEPWDGPKNVASEDPCWSRTVLALQEQAPSSMARQTNPTVEVKQETPLAWKVTLRASEILDGQTINIHLAA